MIVKAERGQSHMKSAVKELLLRLGLYYKIQSYRRPDGRSPAQMRFYATLITPGDTVFDVGANIGQRAELFSRLGNRVIAIEPQSFCVRHLRSRFRFNRRVTICPVACSDADGTARLHVNEVSHTLSTLSERFVMQAGAGQFRGEAWGTQFDVPTRTLDSLISQYGLPSFLKIDVEGHEPAVLRGLSQPVETISFEYNPGLANETHRSVDRLHTICPWYTWNYCVGEDLPFRLPHHVPHEAFVSEVLPYLASQNWWGDIYALGGIRLAPLAPPLPVSRR